MIVVVADTTPLRYLVETGYEYLLPRLFGSVLIPGAVAVELQQERTPASVRRWAALLPSWVEVRQVTAPASAHEPTRLDRGESEAIELAKSLDAKLLLIDERAGARIARGYGFAVTGTLGVLAEAARSGLISIEEALDRLGKTNFRRTPDLFAQTKDLVQEFERAKGRTPE
jgi:uncharacterized protein